MTTTDAPAWSWEEAVDHLDSLGPKEEVVPLPELGDGREVRVRGLSHREATRIIDASTDAKTNKTDQGKVTQMTVLAGVVHPPLKGGSYHALSQHPRATALITRLFNAITDLSRDKPEDGAGEVDAVSAAEAFPVEPSRD